MRCFVVLGLGGFMILSVGCRKAPPPAERPAAVFNLYRFDDQFPSSATVSTSARTSTGALMAEPIVWHNFLTWKDMPWHLVRGRMALREGDLLLQAERGTAVILAPKQPLVEWNRYEAVEVRMAAEGGKEVKIRVGDQEYKQRLGPPRQFHDYRFDVHLDEPGARLLAIMPTDSETALVAINSIRLVPRRASFPQAAGRQYVGKQEDYRNTLYVHSPATVAFEVPVPKQGSLHFGMGVVAKNSPVTFRVLADSKELYSKTVSDPDPWEDAEVDLASYGGRHVKLAFETSAENDGAVGLWANPLLTTKAPKNRPNVLVYLIDTLRADHASLYGYARDTTPFLKKLGAQGLVFEDCQAQATWTKPSTASLLTSLYSYTHGIVRDYDTIPKGATTLAEQLRAAGYVTASIVANPQAGLLTGLQRGFDYMSDWAVVQRRLTKADRGTDSAAVNRILFPWLEQHRDEPFFVYAHTTDPHAPYQPPAGFEEKFANPAETPDYERDCKKLQVWSMYGGGLVVNRAICARNGVDPDLFLRRSIDRYDGEILHNDWSLEQLVDKLKQLGVLDNTLIIVVSDHGEEFWEHGWTTHGHSLYEELTNSVCLMWNPKLIPSPRRISEPVQLIDVMPTVLDLLGLKIPDVVQGQSLVPFIKRQPFERRGFVMTSRFANPEAKRTGAIIPESRIDTVALIDANWKLIYREHAQDVGIKKVELYDRRTDRREAKDVAAQHPQEASRMTAEIVKWMDAQKQIRSFLGHGAKAAMSEETIKKLRSLGYLGGKP